MKKKVYRERHKSAIIEVIDGNKDASINMAKDLIDEMEIQEKLNKTKNKKDKINLIKKEVK